MIITCPSCSTRYPVDAASFTPSGRKVRCAKCGNSWHQNPIVEPPPEPFRIDPSKPPMFAKPAARPAPRPIQSEPVSGDPANEQTPAVDTEAARDVTDDAVDFAPLPTDAAAPVETPYEDPNARRPRVVPTVIVPTSSDAGGRLRAFVNEAATNRRDRVLAILAWSLLGLFLLGTIMAGVTYRKQIVALWPATAKVYAAAGAPVNLQGIEFRNVSYERQSENDLPVLAVMGEVHNVSGETRALPRLRVGLRDKDQRELYHWTFALSAHEIAADQTLPFVTRLSSPPVDARDIEVRFVLPSENEASLPPPSAPDETAAPAAKDETAAPAAAGETAPAETPAAADGAAPVEAPLVEGGH